jgi:hypothetical protein
MKEVKQRSGKMQPPSTPKGGGNIPAGKDHSKTISLGEGLPIGSVHSAHTKESVHQAKENHAPHKAAHAQHFDAIAGKANPMGEQPVGNQKTGHGPLQSSLQNNKVRNKAHAFNERSIAGNADPCGGYDE